MGDLSPHFDSSEFADRHSGAQHAIDPELVSILERIRAAIGRPLPIVSGYRDPATNAAVGGARRSYHLVGKAADLPQGMVTVAQAVAAGARGIGYCRGWAVHVDTRSRPPGSGPLKFADCPHVR